MSRPLDPNVVIDRVAEWYHLERDDILAVSTITYVSDARCAAIRLIHDICKRSWQSSLSLVNRTWSPQLSKKAQKIPLELLAEIEAFVRGES